MIVDKTEKNSEFTFGVHGPSLLKVAPDNAFTLVAPDGLKTKLRELDKAVMGSVRALNNEFELLRQGIVYGLTYRIDRQSGAPRLLFAVYKRNKKNNEDQLISKLSLGSGGHIEPDDESVHLIHDKETDTLVPTAALDFREMLDTNFVREYVEEVSITTPEHGDITEGLLGNASVNGFQYAGFVMDSKPEAGYVGNVHFGVVAAIEAPFEAAFEMKEPQNEAVAWASAEELVNGELFNDPEIPFEPWSKLIVIQIAQLEAYILRHFHGETNAAPRATAQPSASSLGQLDL